MSTESLKTKTDLPIDEFNQLIDNETNVKIYKKLIFLKLKKEGYPTKEAYKLANIKRKINIL